MALVITHTGQSGVERGADRAARTVGFDVGGFSTYEKRDELGLLPPEILVDLRPCDKRGARSALRATLERSDILLIAVPDASRANENAGVEALRRSARLAGVPHRIVDPVTDLAQLATELRQLERATVPLRVMVTGPRLTRWREGERLGWRIVGQLALVAAIARRHRILVVDDHRDTVEASCQLLRALGHECFAAMSGFAGLEKAASSAPNIVLLDISLPDLDGYEVARRLRRAQKQPLFLAAITGWEQAQDCTAAIAAGFDRHIIKPAGAEIIQGLVEQAELLLAG